MQVLRRAGRGSIASPDYHAGTRKLRLHSITSSASTSELCGIVSPSALAVVRLITRSNRPCFNIACHRQRRLLRACNERPCHGRTTECCDEIPPFHRSLPRLTTSLHLPRNVAYLARRVLLCIAAEPACGKRWRHRSACTTLEQFVQARSRRDEHRTFSPTRPAERAARRHDAQVSPLELLDQGVAF